MLCRDVVFKVSIYFFLHFCCFWKSSIVCYMQELIEFNLLFVGTRVSIVTKLIWRFFLITFDWELKLCLCDVFFIALDWELKLCLWGFFKNNYLRRNLCAFVIKALWLMQCFCEVCLKAFEVWIILTWKKFLRFCCQNFLIILGISSKLYYRNSTWEQSSWKESRQFCC